MFNSKGCTVYTNIGALEVLTLKKVESVNCVPLSLSLLLMRFGFVHKQIPINSCLAERIKDSYTQTGATYKWSPHLPAPLNPRNTIKSLLLNSCALFGYGLFLTIILLEYFFFCWEYNNLNKNILLYLIYIDFQFYFCNYCF